MRWQAVTGNAAHNWRITKSIFTDPSNSTLIQETPFEALNGKTVADFNLYLLFKPYLKNVAADNNAMTVVSGANTSWSPAVATAPNSPPYAHRSRGPSRTTSPWRPTATSA